jgi:hypothetical protein
MPKSASLRFVSAQASDKYLVISLFAQQLHTCLAAAHFRVRVNGNRNGHTRPYTWPSGRAKWAGQKHDEIGLT